MSASTPMVNAWIYLNEDEPSGTNYNSLTSCFQTLIQNDVYQSLDMLFICFVTIVPTSATTVPAGEGSSYTIQIIPATNHPGGLTNEYYLTSVISDAKANNPNIKIAVTLLFGNGNIIANIFSNSAFTPQQNADNFAANLMTYLQTYGLVGFDLDWESPISDETTQSQFALLINAVGTQFQKQDQQYYLTLSPAEVGNLDPNAVNNNVSFMNLQLYSGFTDPQEFTSAGVNAGLFAYGAKFESDYQTAQQAFDDNSQNYKYAIFTNWRLNSNNFEFEQTQQQALYALVFP